MGSESTREYRLLSDCTTDGSISYGIVQPGKHVDDGVPIIRVNNVNNGNIDISNVLRVHTDIEKKYRRTRLKGGEVLLTLVGSTGQSFVAPPSLSGWNVPRAIAVIRPKKEVGAEWINICLQSSEVQRFLDVRANTTVQKTLNLKDVRDIPIFMPPRHVKEFIEKCWRSLSKRIELNRRMNETLEAMAQTLFKSWFVDFDPVIDNALANGKEIPAELNEKAQARTALGDKRRPLPEEIRTLFPDEFTSSDELGWIPKGWEVGSLADVCFVKGGYAFKSKDFTTSGYPVIKIKNINNDRTVNATDVQYIPKDIANNIENFWLSPGDLIMAMTGATVGKFGLLVPEMEKTYLLNQRVAKFYPLDAISPQLWFVYCCLCQKNVFDYIVNVAHGSAQPNVSAATIMAATILRPDDEIIRVFNNTFDGNFVKMLSNRETVQTLSNLRDTLLPKLLSGEIRIPDAEKMVEELTL